MKDSIKASPFPLISTREVYRNPWITVREDKVDRPGGRQGIFGVVTMKNGSSVLAVTDDRQVLLTREYKYGIAAESIEVVSGAAEDGESPLDTARRELAEEAGLCAGRWIDAGAIDPFTTIVYSRNHLFIATELTPAIQKLDDGEVIELEKRSLAEALDMVMTGRITHAASCVLILKAQRLLQERAG